MPDLEELIQDFPDVEDTTEEPKEDIETDVEDTTEDKETEEEQDGEEETPKDKTDDKEEGYFADEDEPEVIPPKESVAEVPAVPNSFTPEEKYIVENLPVVSVRVVMADDSIKTLQVRSIAELPIDAKGYASFREGQVFNAAMNAQEMKARELQSYYRQHQTQLQTQEFEKKENKAIRDDIAELQRDGEIPKFKAVPGTRAFSDDPAAKVVQNVIDFMNERNAKYLERANAGAAYRRIGFAEAYELMNGKTADKVNPKDSSARREAARKLVSKQGASTDKKLKAPISGRTIKEVAAEFDDFEG